MGTFCQIKEVVEIPYKKNLATINRKGKRSSFVILDKYSKQKDFRKKYEYKSLIDSGAFGKVHLLIIQT